MNYVYSETKGYKNKRKILFLVMTIILGLGVSMAAVYFAYVYKDTREASLATGLVSINFTEGGEDIDIENTVPVLDEVGLENDPYIFTVQNTSEVPINVKISIIDNGSTIPISAVRYGLYIDSELVKIDKVTLTEPIYIIENLDSKASRECKLVFWVDYYYEEDVESFIAKIKVTGESFDQIYGENKIVRYISNDSTPQLDTGILFYQVNGTDNGNGLFIRSGTENDEYPIYFYRGNINNNNVKFGGFCWKIVRTTDTGGTKMIYNGVPNVTTGACDNTGTSSQLADTASFNNGANSLAYVGYNYGKAYTATSATPTSGAYFGKSVTYASNKYTLNTTAKNAAATRHYTCNSTTASTTCATVRYYYASEVYIAITGGKNINDYINEMIRESKDTTKSNIQVVINNWYEANIKTNYGSYLEDTIWCTDRGISNTNLGAWNPDSGALGAELIFDSVQRSLTGLSSDDGENPLLTCASANDRLSVKNGKLVYPIALLTVDEAALAGGAREDNTNYYLHSGEPYWLLSPAKFNGSSNGANVSRINDVGTVGNTVTSNESGVRPVISIKAGIPIDGGNGTPTNPYLIGPQS